MRKFVEHFVKNAFLYDTKEEYIIAAEKKANGPLTEYELEYLISHAATKTGTKGAEYLWNDKVKRVIGTFSVCDPCLELLGKSNDVVKIVVARVGVGECEICNKGGRVLRKANVDNYGKIARTTVNKTAAVMDKGIIVKIVDAPSRLSALIGSLARIRGVEITHSRGVAYELELENGMRVPYKFNHYQIEEIPTDNVATKDTVESKDDVDEAIEDVTKDNSPERGANEGIESYWKRMNGVSSNIVDELVKEATHIEDDEDRFGIKDEEDEEKGCKSKVLNLSLRQALNITPLEGYGDAKRNIEDADPRTMLETGDLPEMSVDRDFREQL